MGHIFYSRVVDCAHPVSAEMPLWPGDPATRFEVCATVEADGYSLRSFAMSEHAGTHCNAPNTFFSHGADVAHVLRSPLVVPLSVADFSAQAAEDAMALFLPQHLAQWEQQYGLVKKGSLFCLHCGWGMRWDSASDFLGLYTADGQPYSPVSGENPSGMMRYPAFATETVRVLLQERRVAGIGIDTHGVDSPADGTFSVNRFVLKTGGLVLECLANLHLLPPVGSTAVIGGIRLCGGTGSPVSVTVFVP